MGQLEADVLKALEENTTVEDGKVYISNKMKYELISILLVHNPKEVEKILRDKEFDGDIYEL